jgi:hypothetical protein
MIADLYGSGGRGGASIVGSTMTNSVPASISLDTLI